jgi:hypothetical protein
MILPILAARYRSRQYYQQGLMSGGGGEGVADKLFVRVWGCS